MTAIQAGAPPPGTRDRLIGAMLDALRTKGFHGVGISELLSQAQAPKGVLYHHFPGGKTELAVAAIDFVVRQTTRALGKRLERHADPAQALTAWMADAQATLRSSAYQRGCPLATIALESSAADAAIREALARGFAAIRDTLKHALAARGLEPARAGSLAALIVAAYEGGLIQARVAGSEQPMQDATTMLIEMLKSNLAES